ncbi:MULTISPECIES: hypothetical protein [Chryseobacterium]|uniref:hypothetical protein n=1 Tax=Chryseobacterium TaxID=59732 RepID=UPI0024E1BCDD|nr:hypothetical protein [Chryseobacterium sp.]
MLGGCVREFGSISFNTKEENALPKLHLQISMGNIWSIYDPRGASSLMGISYNEEENN